MLSPNASGQIGSDRAAISIEWNLQTVLNVGDMKERGHWIVIGASQKTLKG